MAAPSRLALARRGGIGSVADIALAALVVLVVALMIVPLPTWLLDLLIATNLSAAVAILLVVLYVPDALAHRDVPDAAAPHDALPPRAQRRRRRASSCSRPTPARSSARSARSSSAATTSSARVVFLILTIIQFIVIAKGSERVAEVGARFVLDAMPGKQMAIDAELRAGTIDGNEARRRRRLLARESQFYGAMDGAMKFVKGDVIASLVITVVNILGGLAIGVAQKGMPAVDALKRYGLLTIGDGLVSQIPALVLSTAAGVLVTRVASEEPDTPLGEELARQLFGMPKALQVAAVFVLLLAAVPGLPTVPFLVIGGRSCSSAVRARALSAGGAARGHRADAEGPPARRRRARRRTGVRADGRPVERRGRRGPRAAARRRGRSRARAPRRGVALREQRVRRARRPAARAARARRERRSRRASRRALAHEVPARDPRAAARRARRGRRRDRRIDRASGRWSSCARARRTSSGSPRRSGCSTSSSSSRRRRCATSCPSPFARAPHRRPAPPRRGARQRPRSARDPRGARRRVAATEKDPLNLAEYVRSQLRRAITFRLTRGAGQLGVVLLDPLHRGHRPPRHHAHAGGRVPHAAAAAARDVVAAIRRAVAGAPQPRRDGARGVVILTQPDIRRFVRKLIETELPDACGRQLRGAPARGVAQARGARDAGGVTPEDRRARASSAAVQSGRGRDTRAMTVRVRVTVLMVKSHSLARRFGYPRSRERRTR